MNDTLEPLMRYVLVWAVDETHWCVAPEDEPRIDAAVSRWIDSGETHDTLLLLTLAGGDALRLRASLISSWYLSTPEGRRRELEFDRARDAEREQVKRELGVWDE